MFSWYTGYRLRAGVYVPVPAAADGSVASAVLVGYDWIQSGIHLRRRDRATGHLVPTAEEARMAAEGRAATEAAACLAAEQRTQQTEARAAAAEAALQAALGELARPRAGDEQH